MDFVGFLDPGDAIARMDPEFIGKKSETLVGFVGVLTADNRFPVRIWLIISGMSECVAAANLAVAPNNNSGSP